MSAKSLIHKIILNKTSRLVHNRWIFMSFSGHYSDSPKNLSIKLHELDPTAEIIWCVKEQYKELLPEYVTYAELGSSDADKYISSAEIIIDNVYGERAFFVFGNGIYNRLKSAFLKWGFYKKGQKIYTTWHGTPLKRMGRDQIGNEVSDFMCCNIKMLLGNQFTSNIMEHLTFGKIPMKVLGSPRNDVLFSSQSDLLRDKLNLPTDKKILLFAPTFRNDGKDVEGINLSRSGIDQLKLIDFEQLFKALHTKFGGDWVMVCRFHYHVAEMVDWEKLNKKHNGRIINGNLNDDMAEYLACTDTLITDASSCMFDYILTDKPCFLFFPDLDNYSNKERGFYISIEELPFPLAVSFEELISTISEFDNDEYLNKIHLLKNNLGYMEDGKSTQRVLEWIFKDAGY